MLERARVVAEDGLAGDGELHVRPREGDGVDRVEALEGRHARAEQVEEGLGLRHVRRLKRVCVWVGVTP